MPEGDLETFQSSQNTREGCGVFRDLFGGFRGKLRANSGKNAGKNSRISKFLKVQDLGTQER